MDRQSAVRSPTSVSIRQLAIAQLQRDEAEQKSGSRGKSKSLERRTCAPGNSPGSLAPLRGIPSRRAPSVEPLPGVLARSPHREAVLLRKINSAPDSQHLYRNSFRESISPSASYFEYHRSTHDGSGVSEPSVGVGGGASPTLTRRFLSRTAPHPTTSPRPPASPPLYDKVSTPSTRRTSRILRGLRSPMSDNSNGNESEGEGARTRTRTRAHTHTRLGTGTAGPVCFVRDLPYVIRGKVGNRKHHADDIMVNHKNGDGIGNGIGQMTLRQLIDQSDIPISAPVLDSICLPSNRSPLQEAVFYGQMEITEELLRLGVDADLDMDKGGSPIIIACKLGLCEIAELLMDHGASVNCVDKNEYTALHHACEMGNEDCVKLLLQNGASIRAKTRDKAATPLQLASTEKVRALFQPGGSSYNKANTDHEDSEWKDSDGDGAGAGAGDGDGDGGGVSSKGGKDGDNDKMVFDRPRGDSMFRSSSKRIESGEIEWKRGELLGEGAYGRVYAGLNHETGQIMAVKQIAVDTENEKHTSHMQSLEREVDFYKTLKHKHIIEYYGAYLDKDEQLMFVFLEYVSGGSISSMLSRFGFFSEALAKIYTKQILQGLVFLHENKIVHRDIKGANILITQEGFAKLSDFGASKQFSLENSGSHNHSALSNGSKSIIGSVYFMAPEVMKGVGHGRKADIWSLGCTVVEMLTGKHPWQEYDNTWTAMFQIAKAESGPQLPKDISEEAKEFMQLCFQYDPAKRASARDLLKTTFVS